jgi:regulator of cell morphogenesis and NO signaling
MRPCPSSSTASGARPTTAPPTCSGASTPCGLFRPSSSWRPTTPRRSCSGYRQNGSASSNGPSLEEGPPTWKIEIARRDSSPGEAREITEALEWDHDRLDRLERVAFDAWGAGDLREAEAAFARFAHGLRRHIGFEEALIFPEFERQIGIASTFGPTVTMRAEHRQILALLAAIELAIDSDAEPVALLLRHLRELLRTHDRKEEQIVYPVTDSLLTCEQRNDLIRRIQLFHEE